MAMPTTAKLVISGAVIAGLAVAILGTVAMARFYFGGREQQSAVTVCAGTAGDAHRVAIRGGVVTPESVMTERCDRLIITNHDTVKRRLAFGEHNHHVDYDGADGRLVAAGDTLTLTLSETGEFMFHDHFDEAVHGHFTVR